MSEAAGSKNCCEVGRECSNLAEGGARSSGKELNDDSPQCLLVAFEALDHRRERSIGIELVEVEWMTGVVGEQREEGELRATVTLSERMNGIELGEKVCCVPGEVGARLFSEKVLLPQPKEHALHFRADVLGITEGALSFGEPHRSVPTGPCVHVLKEMMMNRPIVAGRKAAAWKQLLGARERHRGLERFERSLIGEAGLVLKNGAARKAVGIGLGFVHSRPLFLSILAGECIAPDGWG